MSEQNPTRPVIVGEQRVDWQDYQLPRKPPPGHVRVRSIVSLISPGTELALWRGDDLPDGQRWGFNPDAPSLVMTERPANRDSQFPVLTGYNMVGELTSIGDDIDPLRLEERVFALSRHQPVADIPAWEATPVPDSLDSSVAAFSYLPTLGLASLRKLSFSPGHRVAVIGLGMVGGLALITAEALGAEAVGIERSEKRRQIWADSCRHAEIVAPELAPSDSFQIVIEASGNPSALSQAFKVASERGAVGVLGLHTRPLGALLADHFYSKRLSLVSCRNDPHLRPGLSTGFTLLGNLRYVSQLLVRGIIDPTQLITHRLPAGEIEQAYEQLATDESTMGVLLDWA